MQAYTVLPEIHYIWFSILGSILILYLMYYKFSNLTYQQKDQSKIITTNISKSNHEQKIGVNDIPTHNSSGKSIHEQKIEPDDILINDSKSNDKQKIEADDIIINKFMSSYDKPIKTPYIIGICGGSGAGKTFVTKLIVKAIKQKFPKSTCGNIVVISQDSYYSGGDSKTNYDIPSAIDFNLLINHLKQLIIGKSINCPIYDFSTHSRKKETNLIKPAKIIIVEGILIFTQEELRNLFNMKIFINAAVPTQIFRRATRDIRERGRTIEEVQNRYERDVWPSFNQFVLPSSQFADISINNYNGLYVGIQITLNHIITICKNICQDNQ